MKKYNIRGVSYSSNFILSVIFSGMLKYSPRQHDSLKLLHRYGLLGPSDLAELCKMERNQREVIKLVDECKDMSDKITEEFIRHNEKFFDIKDWVEA